MDTTQQTIGQIVGDFTELAHDLHDQGVINEGKLKELLDLGMALSSRMMWHFCKAVSFALCSTLPTSRTSRFATLVGSRHSSGSAPRQRPSGSATVRPAPAASGVFGRVGSAPENLKPKPYREGESEWEARLKYISVSTEGGACTHT